MRPQSARASLQTLRSGSRRLSALNRQVAVSLDQIAGATVRLYSTSRQLARTEQDVRDSGVALLNAALRSVADF